jgi:hypothetical protein
VPLRRTILVVVIVIIVVGVELADARCAFGKLGAGTGGVADAVDFLAVTTVLLVAGTGSVDHGLADSAALVWNVVVVEFLGCDGANGNEADEEEAVLVLHDCSRRCYSRVKLLGVIVDA